MRSKPPVPQSSMQLFLFLLLSSPSSPATIEGDILVDPVLQGSSSAMHSTALANPQRLWPSGRVYYVFDEGFNERNRAVVRQAMDYMTRRNPCITFEDIGLSGETRQDYVKIFNGVGCSSQLGRVGGEQVLNLNSACLEDISTAVHELCHTLGFLHEHTRPDRDEWVEVVQDNIQTGKEENFKRQDEAFSEGFDSTYDSEHSLDTKSTPYDLESVLHYGFLEFSKNKKEVMKYRFKEQEDWPLQDPQDPLTIIDSVEIALVYTKEANCVIRSLDVIKYVHYNRMQNRIIIGHNQREIEQLKSDSNAFKDEVKTMKTAIESLQSLKTAPSESSVPEANILPTTPNSQGIELRGGSSRREGNLFVDGKPVCDDYWETNLNGNQNAGVVCRMLGFSKGVPLSQASGNKRFGDVPTDWSMDDVKCTGTETDIRQCPARKNCGRCSCGAIEGAGVVCSESSVPEANILPATPNSQGIELVGGSSRREGNLFVDGKPVCDDFWQTDQHGNQNAGVVCRMLGFSKGTSLGGAGNNRFGAVPYMDWSMNDVKCTGAETDIRQCPAVKNCGNCNCKAHEGAGVVCSESSVPEANILPATPNSQGIELRGGSSRREGNLFVDGKPVCDDRWGTDQYDYGNRNAGVVCRMLGFSKGVSGGNRGKGRNPGQFGTVPYTDWSMTNVKCTGTETDIRQCPARKNCGDCGCKANEGAGVVCAK